jgi:hypothetical protein
VYVVQDEHVRRPRRDAALPYIDLFMPFDDVLRAGERTTFNLAVGFKFPKNVAGIVQMKNSTAKKMVLSMNQLIVGKITKTNVKQGYNKFFFSRFSLPRRHQRARGEQLHLPGL